MEKSIKLSHSANLQKKQTSKRSMKKARSAISKWKSDPNFKAKLITLSKTELSQILEETNTEEVLMSSIVQQNKALKTEISEAIQKSLNSNAEETEFIGLPTVKINLSPTCPICEKNICEIMYALHDYEHDRLAHFDCVYKKAMQSVKEKLTQDRFLAYTGSGSFGIIESSTDKKITLIEKIYPGAPVEEILHGGTEIVDEEI